MPKMVQSEAVQATS